MKKIVKGNDFVMRIPVMKMVNGEKVAFPLPACTDIVVNLVSASTRRTLKWSISANQDNLLLARVEGDKMPKGAYALEVKGKLFGNDWRSNEYEQVMIVDHNAEADTDFFSTDEGEDSVEMDTAVVIATELGDVPLATKEKAGVVKIGDGIDVNDGEISVNAKVKDSLVQEGTKPFSLGTKLKRPNKEGAIALSMKVVRHAAKVSSITHVNENILGISDVAFEKAAYGDTEKLFNYIYDQTLYTDAACTEVFAVITKVLYPRWKGGKQDFYVSLDRAVSTELDAQLYYIGSELSEGGNNSVSIGDGTASGDNSVSIGGGTASGDNSVSIGGSNSHITLGLDSDCRFSLAGGTAAEGNRCFAYKGKATGYDSIVFGRGLDNGYGATAEAKNIGEVVFGCGNISRQTSYGTRDDTVFVIGNGYDTSQHGSPVCHNAFEVRRNGDIYIPDPSWTGTDYWNRPMVKLTLESAMAECAAMSESSIMIDSKTLLTSDKCARVYTIDIQDDKAYALLLRDCPPCFKIFVNIPDDLTTAVDFSQVYTGADSNVVLFPQGNVPEIKKAGEYFLGVDGRFLSLVGVKYNNTTA